jgi:DNA-binding response OmpR family regulator
MAVLLRRGLQVDLAANGAEALHLLAEKRYAILLLDLMMPLVNGQDVVAALTALPPDQRPLILVITAGDESDVRELDRTAVAGVIRKPFDIFEVAELVRACTETPSAAKDLQPVSRFRLIERARGVDSP